MVRLDDKLARIRGGLYQRSDFIIADAKDPDMGPGLHAVGPARAAGGATTRFATRAEFLDSIAAIIKQDVVDIMLTSASNLEQLAKRKAFAGTGVKPAIRANDTTDIWRHRGGTFHHAPSRPFRTRLARRTSSRSPTSASIRSPSPTTSTPTSPRSRRSRSSAPTPPPTASPISSRSSIRTSSGA